MTFFRPGIDDLLIGSLFWLVFFPSQAQSLADDRVSNPPLRSASPSKGGIPEIASFLKPAVWKRMVDDKEIMVHANLESLPEDDLKKYTFYAAMRVSASVSEARKVLTDYSLYSQMIPYVDQAVYSAESHILEITGGIWNFKLRSEILFEEPSEEWIHYRIVSGSFSGLVGNVYFEPFEKTGGVKETIVYLDGELVGASWPPRLVIERGAEIVFGFTARRMRSYTESRKKLQRGEDHGPQGQQIPQPRTHL